MSAPLPPPKTFMLDIPLIFYKADWTCSPCHGCQNDSSQDVPVQISYWSFMSLCGHFHPDGKDTLISRERICKRQLTGWAFVSKVICRNIYLEPDGRCIIGLQPIASIPLLVCSFTRITSTCALLTPWPSRIYIGVWLCMFILPTHKKKKRKLYVYANSPRSL